MLGRQGARSVPRYLTGPGPIGGNKVWLILAKQGPNSARPAVSCCLCQMVTAYFRFPLGVYALTTARSTGTSQISDDFVEGIEFEAVSIASSSSPLFATRILDKDLGSQPQQFNMPSQEAGSNAAPGSSSGRQAQDAQGTGETSPPRTEQELAQVRTPKSKSPPKQ